MVCTTQAGTKTLAWSMLKTAIELGNMQHAISDDKKGTN